ncbi:DUF956 family protein [Lactococcus fujiensis]|uniref:Uncharacterized protein n=1 Tax=Lactococcus fujiensis JCM 16395 TaxID=1291764 RepID=A0A2A5RPM8_9LACT|nr:DUF956 family protein [Lactococcus fujiensis]PCS01339.1 hypothetical protein RT41_GL000103 [Lactococcus fujiensis JCM 16395]
MIDLANNEIELKTSATVFLGAQMEGYIKIGNLGFEFEYKNKRLGKNISLAWYDIVKVEMNVSVRGKLKNAFSIETSSQTILNFISDDAGKILKLIREHIGKDRVVRAPNLLSVFSLKN